MCSAALHAMMVFAQTSAVSWTIPGNVHGSDGATLPGARISAALLTPAGIAGAPPVITKGIASRALASFDGSFQITGTGTGTFVICIQPVNALYLDPCHWSATPMVVTIKAGGVQPSIAAIAEKGVSVTVNLNDAGSRLVGVDGKSAARVVVGYYNSKNLFYRLPQTSAKAHQHIYSVTIPASATMRFSIASSNVDLADEQGNAVRPEGKHFQVKVPPGQSNQDFNFTVQGVRKP